MERVLDAARDIRCFSLNNNFCGTPVDDKAYLRRVLEQFSFAKLRHLGGTKYQIDVHSNLWYEFAAGEGNAGG